MVFMYKDELRVLILEDMPADTLLLVEELKKGSNAIVHLCVDTREDFIKALSDNTWDVIISDYSLPRFSGPEALKIVRNKYPDLPFIVVSGVYGEDAAVEVMKAGADDFIVKGKLSRLMPAVERELEAAQDRRLRKRAEGAMQFLAAIVESSEDAIYGKNLDSVIVSWNPAAERIYGYSAEEIIGRSNTSLFPLNRRNELLENVSAIRRGETIGPMETERLHKGGRIVPVSITISPIRNSKGEIIGASTIARDITIKKQADHEREQLIQRLVASAQHVKKLAGMVPICASCKRIRDDKGYWEQVESYISKHTDAVFSHGLCPECAVTYEKQFDLKG